MSMSQETRLSLVETVIEEPLGSSQIKTKVDLAPIEHQPPTEISAATMP
jgi:hypothetical protein